MKSDTIRSGFIVNLELRNTNRKNTWSPLAPRQKKCGYGCAELSPAVSVSYNVFQKSVPANAKPPDAYPPVYSSLFAHGIPIALTWAERVVNMPEYNQEETTSQGTLWAALLALIVILHVPPSDFP